MDAHGDHATERDIPLKVTGEAIFGSDIRMPGMLYAAVKACPVWGGDVRSYDFDAIRTAPACIRPCGCRATGHQP